ncbi:M24 family metallopeptidase [Gluconacetobacter sp. Hr-1-5]|uniref:M24 family metallopeptidase n=1 Tax=Gluconacetobacter sp. Hr-1-5 TaxID=3395370 RepID=UPI003B51E80C
MDIITLEWIIRSRTGTRDEMTMFDLNEYVERLRRVRGAMAAQGLDALVVDEIESMAWLSGYGVSETLWRCCCVPKDADPFLVVRELDMAPAAEKSWISDISGFLDWHDPVVLTAGRLAALGSVHRVGVDFGSPAMTAARLGALRAALGAGIEVCDTGRLISTLRLIKSDKEIACLARASSIADIALGEAIAAVRPGGTERDILQAAATAFMENGADDTQVGPITSGKGWGFLHGFVHDTCLEDGDIAHIELIPKYRGYSARIMRSVVVGEATAEQQATASSLVALQDRQIAAMWPGACARDVDAIMREGVLEAGLRTDYTNITGYTLGLYCLPSQRTSDFTRIFHPDAEWLLEEDMVFHMYTSARGLAFSETVLVTAKGPKRLTAFPRRLYQTA